MVRSAAQRRAPPAPHPRTAHRSAGSAVSSPPLWLRGAARCPFIPAVTAPGKFPVLLFFFFFLSDFVLRMKVKEPRPQPGRCRESGRRRVRGVEGGEKRGWWCWGSRAELRGYPRSAPRGRAPSRCRAAPEAAAEPRAPCEGRGRAGRKPPPGRCRRGSLRVSGGRAGARLSPYNAGGLRGDPAALGSGRVACTKQRKRGFLGP